MRIEFKLLLGFLSFCLLAIVVVFFAENVRGAKRLEEAIAMAKAEGIAADVPMTLKSPVLEEENFFHGPMIGSLSDFELVGSAFDWTGERVYRNPEDIELLKGMKFPDNATASYQTITTGVSGIDRGELADFEWWSAIFRASEKFSVSDSSASFALQCLQAMNSEFVDQFAALEEASSRPQTRAPIHWSDGVSEFPGRQPAVSWETHSLVIVLSFRYAAAVEAGEWEEARKSLDVILALVSGFMASEHAGATHWGGIQLTSFLGAVRNGLVQRQLNEDELRYLQARLDAIEFVSGVAAGFAGTIRDCPPFFDSVKKDRDQVVWLFRGPYAPVPRVAEILKWASPDGWFDLNCGTAMKVYLDEGYIPWRDLDFSGFSTANSRIYSKRGLDTVLVSMSLEPGTHWSLRLATTHIALEHAILACALERFRLRHGRLPDDLEELVPDWVEDIPVDPFDGNPMRYRPEDDVYVLYSVGPDGLDDGGKFRTDRRYFREPDSGDWVWSFDSYTDERSGLDREKDLFRMNLEEEAGEKLSDLEFRKIWRSKLREGEATAATEKERRQALMIEKAHQRAEEDRAKLRQ